MGWESFGLVGKVLITRLLLVIQVWDGKPTYRKSWTVNLTCQSADIMTSLCGIHICMGVHENNFSDSIRPRGMLFYVS